MSKLGPNLIGRSIREVTLNEFLSSIDGTLLLKPVTFRVKDTATGLVTTYYIDRDRRPHELPYPEKKQ